MATVPSDEEFLAYNQGVISEFRANHGVVSQPPFPILLLTTTGARTGRLDDCAARVHGRRQRTGVCDGLQGGRPAASGLVP